jgi:tRNA(Arg) A34 adenosine deaminase TadA
MGVIVMEISVEIINKLKDLAKQAFDNKEIPVSAVVVDSMGNIVSEGLNTRQSTGNVLGHAEVNAIQAAGNKLEDWRLDGYSMIVTLEPCEMCSCIIKESRLDKVYYFLPKKYNDLEYNFNINKDQILGYEEDKEYFLELLTSFFDNKR